MTSCDESRGVFSLVISVKFKVQLFMAHLLPVLGQMNRISQAICDEHRTNNGEYERGETDTGVHQRTVAAG